MDSEIDEALSRATVSGMHTNKIKRERNSSIKKMREKGRSMQEIGQFFGISRQRVHQLLADVV